MRVLLRATPTVTSYNGHLRGPVKLSYRAFVSGSVTTSFSDLGLSRPVIEPRSPACEAKALPLSHRGGFLVVKSDQMEEFFGSDTKT